MIPCSFLNIFVICINFVCNRVAMTRLDERVENFNKFFTILSDIDFAILTKNNKTFYKIAGELDDLPTPYKFDIINYSTLEDCAIKESIDKYGKIFYIRKKDSSI